MVAALQLHRATAADLARLPPDVRAEIIDGEIVEKAVPSVEHADAQGNIIARFRGPYHGRPDGDRPGGWWILPEVDVELSPHEVYCPDIAGWRHIQMPDRPRG